jgi:multidrug efflux pump subunit AcrA (membrane-fusion protein)
MSDPSKQIHQLKIDRSAAVPAARRWPVIWILLAVVAVAALAWAAASLRSSTVVVELDVARKPASVAAANSVLDASGYVVARRQTTVSSKVTGKVMEVFVEEGMVVEEGQVVA